MERIARTLLLALALLAWVNVAFAQPVPTSGGQDGASPAAATQAVSEEPIDAAGADGAGRGSDSAEFNRRLLTTEEEVNGLKERVFRAKATLQLLKEIVIQGSTSGARAVLWHKNELGPAFTIQSINYYLDGQSIFSKTVLDESLSGKAEFRLHDGPVPAGNHTIAVSMVLRGNGFGVFSYVDKYTFNVQSSYAFTAEDGKSCEVWIRVKERKGVGRSFVERPWVEYDLSCTRVGPTGI